jgi:cellulose synthase/poly-beta-1,6-N-acetylglucosamine synthase-like glycosyltransferase
MNSDTFKIGILIPVYNEEIVIKGTIDALVAAGASVCDIYVVNDKSTDDTAAVASKTGVSVYTVPVNGGKASAQKEALRYFQLTKRYEWIIFLDGDTKVDTGFLKAMRREAELNPCVGLFVGQVKSVKNSHIYSATRAFDYTYGQDIVKTGQSNFNVIFVSPGCASMYKSSMLEKMHIDHMTLAEDMDLTMQAHRMGYKVVYVPGASVNTQDPSTFQDYHKQVLRWYRGFWQVVKKHEVFSFKKKQRVDWYMMLVTMDSIIFNRILWLVGLLIFNPAILPLSFVFDFCVAGAISFYVAYRTKRLDSVYKFPVYYWLSYVNFYAYMRAFVEIIIQKKELLAWNKVKRYDFDSHIQKENS